MKTWFKQPPQHFVWLLFSFLVSFYMMLALFCVQASGEMKVLYSFSIINLSQLDKTLRIFKKNVICSVCVIEHIRVLWIHLGACIMHESSHITQKILKQTRFWPKSKEIPDQSSLYSHFSSGVRKALSFVSAYSFCGRFGLPLGRCSRRIVDTLQADPTR